MSEGLNRSKLTISILKCILHPCSFEYVSRLAVHISNRAIGTTAFSYLGPKLWNDLPIFIHMACSVQSFKMMLKTHLFPSD